MLAESSEGVLSTCSGLWRRLQEAGRAYGAGDKDAARAGYLAVWEEARAAGDDYHACAAAHMLGVSEPTPAAEKMAWPPRPERRGRGRRGDRPPECRRGGGRGRAAAAHVGPTLAGAAGDEGVANVDG